MTATAAGPDLGAGLDHPAVRALEQLLPQVEADADRLEREGVTRADVDCLAAAGLLAVTGPERLGGAPAPVQRRVAELLAGASPDLWFVWFQHGPVVKMLAAVDGTPLADRRLAALCAGETVSGVAFSHLRSTRPGGLSATRADGGWRLSGRQPWATGWGIVDVVLAGATTSDGRVVLGFLPARDGAGVSATPELPLAVMAGTATVALDLDGALLPDDEVLLLLPAQEWHAADARATANVQPSTFGVALSVLDRLAELDPGSAGPLRERLLAARTEAYDLADSRPAGEAVEERLAVRARALLLGVECATALLAARGGAGVGLADPAQRLLRAAAFQLVHAQTGPVRRATLATLAAR